MGTKSAVVVGVSSCANSMVFCLCGICCITLLPCAWMLLLRSLTTEFLGIVDTNFRFAFLKSLSILDWAVCELLCILGYDECMLFDWFHQISSCIFYQCMVKPLWIVLHTAKEYSSFVVVLQRMQVLVGRLNNLLVLSYSHQQRPAYQANVYSHYFCVYSLYSWSGATHRDVRGQTGQSRLCLCVLPCLCVTATVVG